MSFCHLHDFMCSFFSHYCPLFCNYSSRSIFYIHQVVFFFVLDCFSVIIILILLLFSFLNIFCSLHVSIKNVSSWSTWGNCSSKSAFIKLVTTSFFQKLDIMSAKMLSKLLGIQSMPKNTNKTLQL